MSQFSTGELAKAAEVSVRTVQYYDQRGILTPSEVTEGGRRIYHESDLERLQVICFYLTKTTSCASGSEKLLAMYQKKSP